MSEISAPKPPSSESGEKNETVQLKNFLPDEDIQKFLENEFEISARVEILERNDYKQTYARRFTNGFDEPDVEEIWEKMIDGINYWFWHTDDYGWDRGKGVPPHQRIIKSPDILSKE